MEFNMQNLDPIFNETTISNAIYLIRISISDYVDG